MKKLTLEIDFSVIVPHSAYGKIWPLGAVFEGGRILGHSLQTHGFMSESPLVVAPAGDGFRILDGHRRYYAWQALRQESGQLAVKKVPATVVRGLGPDKELERLLYHALWEHLTRPGYLDPAVLERAVLHARKYYAKAWKGLVGDTTDRGLVEAFRMSVEGRRVP